MFRSLKRKAPAEKALYCFVSVIFMIVALSYLYILIWMILSGAKTHTEIVRNPFSLPQEWHWEHFVEVFKALEVNGVSFLGMLLNSVWFSTTTTFLTIFTSLTFAYTCTKYTFPGSKWIYPIILVVLTLPIYGTSGANYRLLHNLGLIDNYWIVLTAASGFNMNFLYFRAFLQNLSWTYAEAAKMDGANDFQIYFKVMLPLCRPIFGALFLTGWMGAWNSYDAGLINYPNLPTIPVGIYLFNTEMIFRARLDILFTGCLLVTIPSLILFVAFNKVITTNISVGGIKG